MTDEKTTPDRFEEQPSFDPFDSADATVVAGAAPEAAEAVSPASDEPSADEPPAQYGIGPFSLREVSLLGVWLLAFLFSFFPLYVERDVSRLLGVGHNVWTSGIDWILTIGVPTAAVFLIVLRRFSPNGIRRVGSLGVDQFASVAFSVAALAWGGWLWTNISRAVQSGFWLHSWVVWVEVVLMLAAVALTVFAPIIAPFHQDFLHRPEERAHRVARATRPVVARPLADARFTMAAPSVDPDPQPETELVPETDAAAYAPSGGAETAVIEPLDTVTVQRDVVPAPTAPAVSTQPFWALVPVDRDVVDETGAPVFTVGPTAWALVVEDRGDAFVIRAEDGRVGSLHDVSGVTRG